MLTPKSILLLFLLVISIGANVALSRVLFTKSKDEAITTKIRQLENKYAFVSPRVFQENANDVIVNFTPLRNDIKSYTDEVLNDIGIYFEYLPSGTSIGVNDRNEFYQASLIKVPMAMVMYKRVESGDIKLTDKLTIKDEHIDDAFGSLWKKGPGFTLTVQEAIDAMLVDSDNTAYKVLFSKYPTFLDEIFDYLDLPKDSDNKLPIVSPKNYASIFRALYLSAYLTPQHSNEVLEILQHTNFSNKIPAGIPKNVPVAHKIGVLRPEKIFSDCGIVYVPKRPYILCAMVRGSEEQANEQISTVSRMIYEFVSQKRIEN